MSLPIVAIVGRPNVGKSSLLNCLIGRRLSIVDPTPGVTRDRVSAIFEEEGHHFELVDTGGIGTFDVEELAGHVETQIDFGINTADLIVFLVDVRDGLTPTDRKIAERLRKTKKDIIVCANKADSQALESQTGEFYKLGLGDVLPISAKEKVHTDRLVEMIKDRIPACEEVENEPIMKLAIVGKRNAGKSTLVNTLSESMRQIVSDVPGTTRDCVDVRFEHKGQPFLAIDTAGLRRARSVQDSVEFYSHARTERAMRRGDVALFLIDATEVISNVDQKIGKFLIENCKPCVIVINKWDLVEEKTTDDYIKYINAHLKGLDHSPIVFCSGLTGLNVGGIIETALDLYRQAGVRVSTSELNKALGQITRQKLPRMRKHKKVPKFFYMTQVEVHPPTFIVFMNDKKIIDREYVRYMENQLRKKFDFPEVPLRIFFKNRQRVDLEER